MPAAPNARPQKPHSKAIMNTVPRQHRHEGNDEKHIEAWAHLQSGALYDNIFQDKLANTDERQNLKRRELSSKNGESAYEERRSDRHDPIETTRKKSDRCQQDNDSEKQ